jgi:ferritin
MMICGKLANLLNEQIGHELGASHQYLAAAVFFADKGLDKWADVFYRQSDEERTHALKIIHFLNEVGVEVELAAIEAADPKSFTSELDVVQKSLAWERTVTQQFRAMAKLAQDEPDPVGGQFLIWFLNEQIEEENTMDKLAKILESGLNPFMAETLLADATAEVGGEA